MPRPMIEVENLGKRYRISVREKEPLTLWESISAPFKAPFSYLRKTLRAPTEAETLWAIRNVSFQVQEGEVLGVLGRNGAGKSTLLKTLARITDPTEGRAIMRGRVGSLLEVGTGFHAELTGRENIYLSGAILGMKKAEIDRKLDEIIAFAEIERFLDMPIKRYSSGMAVRLGFAVAAHLEPEILIVDEVLAVGDASFQRKCLGKMSQVANQGRTVLFVSHNVANMLRLCPRGILLERGQLVGEGAMEAIVKQYMSQVIETRQQIQFNDLSSAPGSDQVRLMGACVVDADGEPAVTVNIEEPIEIHYRYCTLKPNVRFRCAVNFSLHGTMAFTTMEPLEYVHAEPGVYEAHVVIPGNLLAEGDYSLDVSIFTSRGRKVRHLYLTEALGIHVYDPLSGNSARGDYTENYGGLLRPRLNWHKAFLGRDYSVPVALPQPLIEPTTANVSL